MQDVLGLVDREDRYTQRNYNRELIREIIKEYQDDIKDRNCLGRYTDLCFAVIRVPKWDEFIQPGYDSIRKGFTTIELGVGPEYTVSFYGFAYGQEIEKWDRRFRELKQ